MTKPGLVISLQVRVRAHLLTGRGHWLNALEFSDLRTWWLSHFGKSKNPLKSVNFLKILKSFSTEDFFFFKKTSLSPKKITRKEIIKTLFSDLPMSKYINIQNMVILWVKQVIHNAFFLFLNEQHDFISVKGTKNKLCMYFNPLPLNFLWRKFFLFFHGLKFLKNKCI